MGLLQKAVETYDCHREYAGKLREGHDVLAPVSHSLTRAKVEITINANGDFVSAQAVDKDAPKIVIPVTEESAGRSGTGAFKLPHPLCDKLSYLIAEPNYYIPQLDDWAQSSFCHPKTLAILNYVKRKTLLSDLSASGCVTRNDKGEINQKDDMICWRVIGRDEETPSACWMDQSLFEAYSSYYQAKKAQGNRAVCMISGEELPAAVQHPKGIVAFSGNAKLISSNDDKGFTYRGRFDADWQAVSVGYVSTQKAHNALRWIISEQGAAAVFGGRTFLCWNPKGYQVCSVVGPFRKNAAVRTEPTDYRKELQRTLAGYQTELPEMEGVVIAAFDAATSGRLSLTYYNELIGSDFLQRLYDWDLTCCWHNGP